ncbi:PucR family transcriptional regulator [Brevibacterium ravenspurgense]|uniref:PucR family transcriptional regulator n=1 Tax=Brevibacterium ravenspurgense TaxID=479117 RepID=UPI00036C6E5E|nr:helix-turn-helix domain-containing protein [Brevibacterium ravenspurgense]
MASQVSHEQLANALREQGMRLLPEIIAYVRRESPMYIDVTDAEIEDSLKQNVEMCIRSIGTNIGNSDSYFMRWAQISRSRFEKGVPLEEIFQTYRHSVERLVEILIKLLNQAGYSAREQVEAISSVWKSANAYTVKLANVYNHHQQLQASQSQAQKEIIFDTVKNGSPFGPSTYAAAQYFHLNERAEYSYFIAAFPPETSLPAYESLRMVEARLTNGRGICTATAFTIEGFSTEHLTFPEASISVGPPRLLPDLHESFRTAEQITRTSKARKPGLHRLSDVGWRLAVCAHPDVLHLYEQKYITPLRQGKADAKSLLDSLDAYLIHNANVTAAAVTLHCHPNTLRYRLSRFEELTSCSIEHTETRVELAWLLESMKTKEQLIN